MKPVERKTRSCTAQGDAVPLSIENGIVQVFLSRCESARYWPGACDICDIAAVFLYKRKSEREKLTGWGVTYPTSVHKDQFAVSVEELALIDA